MLNGPCRICGEHTNSLAGNPTLWTMWLQYHGGNGRVKAHHIGCVIQAVENEIKARTKDA